MAQADEQGAFYGSEGERRRLSSLPVREGDQAGRVRRAGRPRGLRNVCQDPRSDRRASDGGLKVMRQVQRSRAIGHETRRRIVALVLLMFTIVTGCSKHSRATASKELEQSLDSLEAR